MGFTKQTAAGALQWWATPINAWNRRQRWWAASSATAITAGFAALTCGRFGSFWKQSDGQWYRALATGHGDEVIQPFAARQLHALVVRGLTAMLGWSVERAFVVVGVVCLLFLLAAVFGLMTRTAAPRWMLAAFIVLPFWPLLLAGLVLPDIWYAAMIAVLLLLLEQRRWLWAAAMMLPLMVSRESTMLTLACLMLAGWRELRWRGGAVAFGSTVLGSWIVHLLTAGGRGNREGLSQGLYLLGKAPWNGLRNVLGVQPWSNVYPLLCEHPRWQWQVHVGPVRAVGVCSVQSTQPLHWLLAEMTAFGLFPILATLWLRDREQWRQNALLRFCVLYGGAGFVLTPLLGTSVQRLVGYGWPLPLVAIPLIAGRLCGGWRAGLLLVAHLGLCLIGLHLWGFGWWPTATAGILTGLGMWLAWKISSLPDGR
jgi:hypothetical protein